MEKNIAIMLEGFTERMKHVGMFAPILRVENPSKFKELPISSIVLYVLLYMLENKLSLNTSTTKEELQFEIYELVKHNWCPTFTTKEAIELEEWLVSKHLRNHGKAHEFTYFDFEKGEERKHFFHLIEYGERMNVFADHSSETTDFALTSTGLELLFKTKEVFGELRITMSQLFFRKQFEKGLFTDALRRIQEMHTLIEDEKKRIKKLQSSIIKDALGVSQRNDLANMLKQIHDTLKLERDQFRELQNLVEEKINEYHEGRLTEREAEGIHVIQEIGSKLNEAINLHESLFTEKQKTQNIMSDSLESSIVHAFSVYLDFEQEILNEIVESPVNEETLNIISKPLLPFRHKKIFNPLVVFTPQSRIKRKESKAEAIIEIDEETILMLEEKEELERQEQESREFGYVYAILSPLTKKESYTLKDVLTETEVRHPEIYHTIIERQDDFLGFVTELHQAEYNQFEQVPPDIWQKLSGDKKVNRLLIKLTNELPLLESVNNFSLMETDQYYYLGTMRYRNLTIIRGDFYGVGTRNR
ncbi:hypothetical protein ACFVR2_07455 [Gottfriedia sp. NPDC057991]|uniref:hypothetical protein n=1 Tax=Gottfriedia sp. NPDC057991 TaxID=3346298 RepID=UPI0036DE3BD6